MIIKFFDRSLEQFVASLDHITIAKVLRTIDLLETFGIQLGLPHARKVQKHIFELRIHGKQEVRILYICVHGEIILLHGYIKKSQKMPRKELHTAVQKYNRLTKE